MVRVFIDWFNEKFIFDRSEMWLHTLWGVPKEPLPGRVTSTRSEDVYEWAKGGPKACYSLTEESDSQAFLWWQIHIQGTDELDFVGNN